jgi:hypothetical protein
VREHLPSVHKVLGSILSTAKRKKKERKGGREEKKGEREGERETEREKKERNHMYIFNPNTWKIGAERL